MTDTTNPVETSSNMQPRSPPTRWYTLTRCYLTSSSIRKSVHILFRQTVYNGNFPQHINTHTYCGMQYRIINTFAGLSAFGSPLDNTMWLATDWCCGSMWCSVCSSCN